MTPAATTAITTSTPENNAPAWTTATHHHVHYQWMEQTYTRYPVLHEKAVRQEIHLRSGILRKLASWNDHWKLMHLMSNLQVQWSCCVLAMRCKYTLLVAAMKRRFTPIQMTAVQAQLFHNRQQQEKGTMDQFSKTYIQKLYNLAYAGLSNQQSRTFWRIGLWTWPDHKLKFIHTGWGALEERFKEAKTQKLVGNWQRTSAPSNSITPILWTTLYPIDNLYSEQFTHWSKKRGQNKVLRLQYGWSYSKKLPVL